jgi:DNA-binding NarL/FixJ family response regulator
MVNQFFKSKSERERALLLSQIEEIINSKFKKIADDIADKLDDIISKLKDIITVKSDDPPACPSPETSAKPRIHLMPRQKIVLELIVQGKTNKEIAAEIYLSEGGIKNIVTALLARFGSHDRTQLAVSAVVNKVISEETISIYKNKIKNDDKSTL